MDKNTQAIVASNLTLAYCMAQAGGRAARRDLQLPGSLMTEEDIAATYRRFVGLLDEESPSGFVGVPPYTGGES